MRDDLKTLQFLRGVAVTLVVLFHVFLASKKYLGDTSDLSEMFVYGQTGVDLFFVISGFVMVLSTRDVHQNLLKICMFLLRRFLRIYPPFWFYCLIVLSVYLAYPSVVNTSQGGRVDILRSFLLLPATTLPMVQVAWSLILELWFYILFAVLLLLPSRLLILSLILWATLVSAANICAVVPAAPLVNVVLHSAAVQFVLGALACFAYLRLANNIGLPALAAGMCFFVVAVYIAPIGDLDVISSMNLHRAVLFGLTFSAFVLGMAILERAAILTFSTLFVWIGDWSYSIYLSHTLVVSAFGRMYAKFLGNEAGLLMSSIFMITVVCASLFVGFLSYTYMEYPLLNVLLNKLDRSRAA